MKKSATPPNQASWVRRALFSAGTVLSTMTRLNSRGYGKRRGQQSHELIRVNGGNETVNEEKLRRTGHRGGSPGNHFPGELAEEQKWKHREYGEENQIPRQQRD